jgi:hypothetical protein
MFILPAMTPVAKAERIRRVYKKKHDWMSKVFQFWTGAHKLTEEELDNGLIWPFVIAPCVSVVL